MDNQNAKKRAVALAALEYVEEGSIIGVGTGSTVNYFIENLADKRMVIAGAVASSKVTAERLKFYKIPLIDPNTCGVIPLYIDGADEATQHLQLIKGGGGALTGEKILAAFSRQFICIIDDKKQVARLGNFPLPVEVIPMARSYVARELVKLGGNPVYRPNFISDYGNVILDVFNLDLTDPVSTEAMINNISGVVTNGLFAKRPADILLVASAQGIQKIQR